MTRRPATRPVTCVPVACPYCVLAGTRGQYGCTCGYLRQLEDRHQLERAA